MLATPSLALFLNYANLPDWMLVGCILVGLFFLWFGADMLTNGAAGLALIANINPVVVGLTVVSIATSMPEFITVFISAFHGNPGMAIGNVIGSNICNIGLIMGLAALLCPISVHKRLLSKDVPLLIVLTLLFCFLALDGITRIEGIVLFALAVGILTMMAVQARQGKVEVPADELPDLPKSDRWSSPLFCLGAVLIGTGILGAGADFLVGGSSETALRLGVSDIVVGLTVIAVGTSLPELAASIVAAAKNHADMVAGNIVGSNLFNMLLIGGGVSVFFPLDVEPSLFRFEIPAMIILTVVMYAVMWTDRKVTRTEGFVLFVAYAGVMSIPVMNQIALSNQGG